MGESADETQTIQETASLTEEEDLFPPLFLMPPRLPRFHVVISRSVMKLDRHFGYNFFRFRLPRDFGPDGSFSSRIDSSVSKMTSPSLRKCGRQVGVGDELLRLQSSVSLLKALVVKVDEEQLPAVRRPSLRKLEGIVRKIVYDVDDSLDDLQDQHYNMRSQVVLRKGGGWKDALRNAFAKRAWDATTGIVDVRGRVDIVNCQLKAFLGMKLVDDHNAKEEEEEHQVDEMMMLTPPEQPLVGRDEERGRLTRWLLADDDNVSVLPIVGMGGLGKTTLVRSVVHDCKVLDHFQLRLWVSVTQNFDVKELTRQMLDSVSAVTGEEYSQVQNLDRLQTMLRDELRSKRLLLVLDDVWNEDRSKWEMFCAPLMSGLAGGSKILVTTRSQKVADAMGAMETMSLPVLSDESMWCALKIHAFGSENSENFPPLEAIGKRIAQKLKGLPLAAVTVGRHLNSQLDKKHWECILESDIWKLEQGLKDVLPVLELSYRYLPAHLKSCFSFCALFPKDHIFDKLTLVQMWMAHDYIIPQEGSLIEDVGSEYFDDLLSKSFFQKHCGGYIMHPLLGDLARYVSQDECFTIHDGMSESMMPTTVRHISVRASYVKPLVFIDMCKNKKLRTLLFFGKFGTNVCRALDGLGNQRASIRVLDFGCCDIEKLPDNIGKLKQLRYVDARGTRIQTLPKSFFSLYKLQVLKVFNGSLMHVPKEVTKLINLRYLDIVSCLIPQIEKIGSLASLQELSYYGFASRSGRMIEEMKNMNEHVHMINPLVFDYSTKLNNKRYLVGKSFEWPSNRNACRVIDQTDANARRASLCYDGEKTVKVL